VVFSFPHGQEPNQQLDIPIMNLDEMSLKQLEKLQADVAKAIQAAKDRDLKAARLAVEEAAAKFGFSLSEITGAGDGRRKYTRRIGAASAGAAKYRNPEDATQTWTGKGRQPAWFKAALEKGTDPSDMEI
jgi:DNA-binding protein H-NS